MVATICNKCKASIPEGVNFCPVCGAPRNVQHQTSKSYQPQKIMHGGQISFGGFSPFENIFDMVFSKTAIIVGIAIGILLAWIGFIIITFTTGMSDPAQLISSMGFGAIGLLLIGGGIWNKKIDKFVRLAMVFIGVWAIVQTMSIVGSSIFASLFS